MNNEKPLENEESLCSKLLTIEFKVKAMAYLFENQGSEPTSPLPCELDDIHAGLGKIMEEISEEINMIRNAFESINSSQLLRKPKNRGIQRHR
jgi:hypothetical protein